MEPMWRGGSVFVLFAAAGALTMAGCGGRASVAVPTGAESPSFTAWERPSRVVAVRPAVRLDSPADRPPEEEGDTGEENASRDVQVNLRPGMTLYYLARTHQLPLSALMRLNGIADPTAIPAGTVIVIPNASGRGPSAPAPAGAPITPPGSPRARGSNGHPAASAPPLPGAGAAQAPATMSIAWPIDGRVTGGFGLRGRHHHHEGVDIDGYRGEEIRAVAAGTVVVSESQGKYGKTVVIDHGNGVTTLYAHASRLLVREGDRVEQGETIARVGASGNARGTHLHFEVRRNGKPVDPSPYLQSGTVPLATR